MARLFITPREVDFISDLTKEVTKDVLGQKIYYYRVREELTNVHDVYEEAPEKVFDPPIELETMVDWQPEEFRTNKFGSETYATIEVYVHQRDLIDKDVLVRAGDYFSYGDTFFEIVTATSTSQVYGQIEHTTGVKITGKQARQGQIDFTPIGPTSETYTDDDAVQDTFVQQRGEKRNRLGETNDKRQLQADGKLEKPLSNPAEISPQGDPDRISSSFYDDA